MESLTFTTKYKLFPSMPITVLRESPESLCEPLLPSSTFYEDEPLLQKQETYSRASSFSPSGTHMIIFNISSKVQSSLKHYISLKRQLQVKIFREAIH